MDRHGVSNAAVAQNLLAALASFTPVLDDVIRQDGAELLDRQRVISANALDAARTCGVLDEKDLAPVSSEMEGVVAMDAVFVADPLDPTVHVPTGSRSTPAPAPVAGPADVLDMSPRTKRLLHGPILPTLLSMAWPNVVVMLLTPVPGSPAAKPCRRSRPRSVACGSDFVVVPATAPIRVAAG